MKTNNEKSLGLYVYQYAKVIALCLALMDELNRIFHGSIPYYSNAVEHVTKALVHVFTQKEVKLPYELFGTLILMLLILGILGLGEKLRSVKLILLLLIMISFIYTASVGIGWSVISIGISLFYLMDGGIYLGILRGKANKRIIVFTLLPFSCLLAFMAVLIPGNKEPINWERFVAAADGMKDEFQSLTTKMEFPQTDDFSLTLIGFTGNDIQKFPGGALGDSEDILLTIRKNTVSRGDGYLNGCIRNKYTSTGWEKEEIGWDYPVNEFKMNFFEMMYNLYESRMPVLEDKMFMKPVSYTIKYDSLKTLSVFLPNNSYFFSEESNEDLVENKNGNLSFKEKKGEKLYRVSSLLVNMNQSQLQNYLRSLDGFSYEEHPFVAYDEVSENSAYYECLGPTRQFDFEDQILNQEFADYLAVRADQIEENYLPLPGTIPERVYELAEEITKDCETDLDKIVAIETYLEQFPYTRNVGKVPEGEDFVDYFLFEQQEGYCIHFASSMSVLLRCVGIPSRYVEGTTCSFREKIENEFIVRSYRAHAWTEAYMEGFGWVRVDATPGYGNGIKISFDRPVDTASGNQSMGVQPSNIPSISESTSEVQNSGEKKMELWQLYALISGIVVLGSASVFLCVLYYRQKRIYAHGNCEKKILLTMANILGLLRFYGYGILDGETIHAYGIRICNLDPILCKIMGDLPAWFEEIRYSGKPVTVGEVDQILLWQKEMIILCKQKRGKLRYLGFAILNQIR